MAIYRQIQVSFWQDSFVISLTPEEKYFYMYLLTNSKTTQCGIYEISKRFIEFDTGYHRETVDKLLARFEEYGKAYYNNDTQELMLVNWHKYNYLKSPKVISKIKQELLQVKCDRFRETALDILERTGLADRELYRMANRTEIPKTVARKIFERDKVCVRCGCGDDLTIDHIFPRNIGGTNVEGNLRVLCRSCNSKRPTIGRELEEDLALDGLTIKDMEFVCELSPIPEKTIPYEENPIPYQNIRYGIDNKNKNKNKKKNNKKDNMSDSNESDPIPYQEIIEYLNTKAGKKFRHQTEATRKHIRGRYNDGFVLEDFKKVIDNKCTEWKGTNMAQYLRPETLFSPSKFESYLNQSTPTKGGGNYGRGSGLHEHEGRTQRQGHFGTGQRLGAIDQSTKSRERNREEYDLF